MQAFNEIELAFAKGFTLADTRPPDDHLEDTAIARRQADSFESGLELFPREVDERAHYCSLIRMSSRSQLPIT